MLGGFFHYLDSFISNLKWSIVYLLLSTYNRTSRLATVSSD